MDTERIPQMIAEMIEIQGVSPEVMVGLIGFVGAVVGAGVSSVAAIGVWWLQDRSKHKAMIRRELVRVYEGWLQCGAHWMRTWYAMVCLAPGEPTILLDRATARFDRFNFRLSILDGDEGTRTLALHVATILHSALDTPIDQLRALAFEPKTRHLRAVREEHRRGEKALILRLEQRFHLVPRTGSREDPAG